MPTGPGGLDAQGIWQYGEADTESLASDLLNLGQASVTTQFAADRARLDAIEARILKRVYLLTVASPPTSDGTTLGLIEIPQIEGVAQRVIVDIVGAMGFGANTRTYEVKITSAGGTVEQPVLVPQQVPSGQWGALAHKGYVDIEAGTGEVTIGVDAVCPDGSGYFRFMVEARVLLAGEY